MRVRSLRTGRSLTFRGIVRKVREELPAVELWEAGVITDRETGRRVFKAAPWVSAYESGVTLVRYVNKKRAKEVAEALVSYARKTGDIYI